MVASDGSSLFSRALQERKLSTTKAAELLGLTSHSGYVSRFATGKRKPGRELAVRIFREFGIPVEAWETPVPSKKRRKPAAEAA